MKTCPSHCKPKPAPSHPKLSRDLQPLPVLPLVVPYSPPPNPWPSACRPLQPALTPADKADAPGLPTSLWKNILTFLSGHSFLLYFRPEWSFRQPWVRSCDDQESVWLFNNLRSLLCIVFLHHLWTGTCLPPLCRSRCQHWEHELTARPTDNFSPGQDIPSILRWRQGQGSPTAPQVQQFTRTGPHYGVWQ